MTKSEFATVIAYLEAGCGRPLAKESVRVYFDLLGDLDLRVFQSAARMVALEHPWATFPSIAELRQAATTIAQGEISRMSAAEAWGLAWATVARIDPDWANSELKSVLDRHLNALPPLVLKAMMMYGLRPLCYGKEPVAVVRAQFMRIFEDLSDSDKRMALLPIALKETVKQIGEHPCEQVNAVLAALPSIGFEQPAAK